MNISAHKAPDFVVGIGASAGGLEAFESLFPCLPENPGVAWIVQQHLDPSRPSALADLLATRSPLPVREIVHGMPLEGGVVYVCPPGNSCTLSANRLQLKKYRQPGPRHSIDILFSAIARHNLNNCAGVILSGSGNDGLLGIREIKAAGGWTLVQDPATASYRAMPDAVIEQFLADFIRAPGELGAELTEILRLVRNPVADISLANDADKMQLLFELLEHQTGFNFQRYREPMLVRRIARRMQANRLDSLGEYLLLIKKSRDEAQCLIKDIFIAVTGFFRDRKVFQRVDLLLKELLERTPANETLRIWSAGCATGEEAWSLAMLLAKHAENRSAVPALKIFATDIDPANIAFARHGLYSARAVEFVPKALLGQYFEKSEHGYQVGKQLRELVVFAVHDVALDAPFSKLDLISCRNLLIYFNPATQIRLLTRFHYALRPDGYLLLGSSESAGKAGHLFSAEDRQAKLYRRLEGSGTPGLFVPGDAFGRNIGKAAATRPDLPGTETVSRLQQLRELYFDEYVPAAVLLNSRQELVHVHGNVAPWVSLPDGDIRFELGAMLKPELRADLRLILQQAQRKGSTVRSRPLHLAGESGATRVLTLVAIPQRRPQTQRGQAGDILVVFEQRPAGVAGADQSRPGAPERSAAALAEELTITRELLQANMEALDGANQELQSVTEEFHSTTEELQAINEEFQTANEELESTNEELVSVNAEMRSKSRTLEQTNAELDHILNAALAGIIVLDTSLQVVRASASCRALFGVRPEEAGSIGQLMARLDGLAALAPAIDRALTSGLPLQEELALEQRHFTVRLIPVGPAESSKPYSLILAFHDETERMAREVEAKLLAAIVRNSDDAIIVHDLDGMITNWNSGAEKLFGHAEADVLGSNIASLIEPTERRAYQSHLEALVKSGVGGALETRGVTRHNRHPDLSHSAAVLLSNAGAAMAIAATFRDITEKKSNENKLIALVESTPDPFIIVAADGSIQRINKQAEILFGYSRQELIGKSFKMLVPERFRPQHDVFTRNYQVKPVMRQMASGMELWCLTRSGEEIPVEIGLSPVVSQHETTVMVRFRDIRVQKQEQALLNQAKQKADEANRTKSRFLAAASHDLRQPLQSISMNLGVLTGELGAAEKDRVIEKSRMALDTTNKLLNSLLNITKLEAGKVQPELEAFSIGEVLERVHNTESYQAQEKHQHFAFRNSTALVASDPALLEQLLTNLVANAIRYTPRQGHVLLGCRRLRHYIRVQVADNGPGIASDALDLIFDEYRQLEYQGHYQGKGLGLGLSIVKLLAELLHLKLEVSSVPGRGSSFSVLVPLALDKPKPKRKQPAKRPAGQKRLTGTLLLIDDDPAVLDSTSLFLGVSGFRVLMAVNSAQAMTALAEHAIDLIITDYGLAQEETGVELVDRIRRTLRKRVPAIIITGDMSLQRTLASRSGDFEIICKPIDAQALLQLVQKHF